MPLMITKKPVYGIQADMVIFIREKERSDHALTGNFFRRCGQKLRFKDLDKRIQYVHYTASADDPAFEKSYGKALKRAIRHGFETVAVSCEDEIGFILANKFSKRFSEERDLRIWLCLSENVEISGSSIARLESIFFETEALTGALQHREECDESLCMPVESGETYAPIMDVEEDEDRTIWEKEDFIPPPMPQAKAPPIQSKKAGFPKRSVCKPQTAKAKPKGDFEDLQKFLKQNDAGFKDTLLRYIDRTGKKDSEIYKKANVDRRLFSKILNVQGYNPSKPTAIAFAIALELNLEETKDLIGRAGYTLSQASTFDRIIEFFIMGRNYDIYEINEALFYFDQSLLGC